MAANNTSVHAHNIVLLSHNAHCVQLKIIFCLKGHMAGILFITLAKENKTEKEQWAQVLLICLYYQSQPDLFNNSLHLLG